MALKFIFPPWKIIALICTSSLTTKTSAEDEQGTFFRVEENAFAVDENALEKQKADTLFTCARMCGKEAACKGANFLANEGLCFFLGEGRRGRKVDTFVKRDGSFYVEKVDLPEITAPYPEQNASPSPGSNQNSVVTSCQALHDQSLNTSSGVYWIDPDGGSHANAFKAYCDMDTYGGGWTLVWSYSFTNYAQFTDGSNAITPRPNWPVRSQVDVRISTTPSLNETDYNAMHFSCWKQLGTQVLIKSNINNWLVCHPGTGSLVDWWEGDINCTIIKYVADPSKSSPAPSKFSEKTEYGPMFYSSVYWNSTYYYFDGYRGNNWPTHDPLGKNEANQKKSVVDPHGNIFIRAE